MIRSEPLSSPWVWAVPLTGLLLMGLFAATGSNRELFLWLNEALQLPPSISRHVWLNVTLFGDAGMVMILVLPLVGRRPDVIWAGLLAGIVAALLVNGGKELFLEPRPPAVLDAGSFHQLGNRFGATSFPSGHTSAAFALAGVIALLPFDRRVRWLALGWAALVGLSRIAVGAHWPLDVAAGMVVGWTAALIGVQLARVIPGENPWVQRAAAGLLVFTVYYLVVIHTGGDREARLLEIVVPLLALALALPGLKKLFLPGGRT